MIAPTLIVLLGPTGVEKTELSLQIAEQFAAPVVSCDSRQFYKEMKIGTAAPTQEQLARVTHYFIATRSIKEEYNAGNYEEDAIRLLEKLFEKHKIVLLTGGSMMYIDAVCKGFDELPAVPAAVRSKWNKIYEEKGLEFIRQKLQEADPDYYSQVDIYNHKRIIHALEICEIAQMPYSHLRKKQEKQRPFNILKIGLNRPRAELYERINRRVDQMIQEGLENEARKLFAYRHLNALNTVGYKELFNYFCGHITHDEAISLIKQDTRRYAKRQLTWFNRDGAITWFHPEQKNEIIDFLKLKVVSFK